MSRTMTPDEWLVFLVVVVAIVGLGRCIWEEFFSEPFNIEDDEEDEKRV